ncbi:MAG: putative ABC transport system ATP-binding protein [bacterium]|nr:MAG: putative ABC transport system ATP-binding protein [bacterium]
MIAAPTLAGPATAPENLIEVRGLLSQFGDRVIHEGLDLTLERGEVLGVVGGSGTGKTVLLNSIIGLKDPEGGSVSILGYDRSTMTEKEEADVQRRTGILFQQGALFSSLSVIDNVASPLVEHTGLSADVIRELAEMKIAMVGLKPEAHHLKPAELSGGMRKRVGLARALALDPELLFLDEPTAGLDPIGAAAFDALIRQLSDDLGLTVFMITHDLDSLYAITDKVAVLAEKGIVAKATVQELERSDHPWIREYFLGPRGRAADKAISASGRSDLNPGNGHV